MGLILREGGFDLELGGCIVLRHRPDEPAFFAGVGHERMEMYRGNFDISDRLTERAPLSHVTVAGTRIELRRHEADEVVLALTLEGAVSRLDLVTSHAGARWNRFWFRLVAEPGEHVWGGGEQMSYFDLRGRRFPIWTSEPGVGRDKTTEITFRADVAGRAGGD
jgi:alpha-glucosidase